MREGDNRERRFMTVLVIAEKLKLILLHELKLFPWLGGCGAGL